MRLFTQHVVKRRLLSFEHQPVFLYKIRDSSCLKTEVRDKKGHALRKRKRLQKLTLRKSLLKIEPESPAALKWVGDAKNLRVTAI